MKEKRVTAFIIDYLISLAAIFISGITLTFLDIFHVSKVAGFGFYLLAFMLLLVSYIYMLSRDVICGGRSIGKRIIGVTPIDCNGSKPKFLRLLLHDITIMIWPIEAFMLLFKGETIGQKISKIDFC